LDHRYPVRAPPLFAKWVVAIEVVVVAKVLAILDIGRHRIATEID